MATEFEGQYQPVMFYVGPVDGWRPGISYRRDEGIPDAISDGWHLGVPYRRGPKHIHLLECGTLHAVRLSTKDEKFFRPAAVSRGFARRLTRRRRTLRRHDKRHAAAVVKQIVAALSAA